MFHKIIVLIVMTFCASCFSSVTYQHKDGFTVGGAVTLSTGTEETFLLFTTKISRWWRASHSFSGDANNLFIDVKDQRCFCERLNGGWVEHLKVVHYNPNKAIVFRGGLGPLQSQPIVGVLDVRFKAVGNDTKARSDTHQTKVIWTYRVSGHVEDGLNNWAAAVDGVLVEQFESLKSLSEK